MIVVDTNVVLYLLLPGEKTRAAEDLRRRFPYWAAPRLWRSECRNALALYVRKGMLSLDEAAGLQSAAEQTLAPGEADVDSYEILSLASRSGHSAYDCEFIALAQRLDTLLATEDAALRKAFPETAFGLAELLQR